MQVQSGTIWFRYNLVQVHSGAGIILAQVVQSGAGTILVQVHSGAGNILVQVVRTPNCTYRRYLHGVNKISTRWVILSKI